jgi:hypothetical protein
MGSMDENTAGTLFFGIFIAVAIGFWLFNRRLSFTEKRKWHPRLAIAFGIFFVALTVVHSFLVNTQWSSPWLAVTTFLVVFSGVTGITVLNIKMTKFCERCEEAVVNNSFFRKFEFCPKCGTKLVK